MRENKYCLLGGAQTHTNLVHKEINHTKSHSGIKWILWQSAAVSVRFGDKSLLKLHLSDLCKSLLSLKNGQLQSESRTVA